VSKSHAAQPQEAGYHPADEAYPDTGLLIGDTRLATASGGMHRHLYPGTGLETRALPMAGAAEMDLAVTAARKALPGWKAMPVNQRRGLMLRLADLMDANAAQLERLAVAENATMLGKAMLFRMGATDSLRYYAGWADKIGGDVVPTWPVPAFDYAQYEPYGVLAIILPWNVPMGSFGQIVAGALAAGNTVIVKPSELAPFTSLRIGELALEAGFPAGVVNIVPAGPDGSEALVRHPGIDKIHFTGSGATARRIVASAGLRPVGLELGGKSARILFGDADPEKAVALAVASATSHAGQGCLLGTRLLVEANLYDEVVERARAEMDSRVVGDPYALESHVGPVISEGSRERILAAVARAEQSGSKLVSGGRAIDRPGYYLQPALFADVDNASGLAQEEIFGPVLGITRFVDEADAIRIANDSAFGLGAYLHTDDLRRAHRVASALEVGNIWVNGFHAPASMPFGGAKESGFGRVGGQAGLHEFLRVKNVWMSMV